MKFQQPHRSRHDQRALNHHSHSHYDHDPRRGLGNGPHRGHGRSIQENAHDLPHTLATKAGLILNDYYL